MLIDLFKKRILFIVLCLAILSACQRDSVPPTPLPPPPPTPPQPIVLSGSCSLIHLPDNVSDEEAIKETLMAEGELTVRQDINALMLLWAEGGRVVDAQHKTDASDHQFWIDKDAIRHRYTRIVFPGAPSSVEPADMNIQIQGDQAVVRSTTQIATTDNEDPPIEISPAGDRWELTKIDGCWHLQQLTYNLESEPQK